MTKRNGTIDLFRLLAALVVVFIHTSFTSNVGKIIIETIGLLPVPFFMMISSYYCFKNGNDWRRTKRVIHNLLVMWCVWSLVYLPSTLFSIQNLPLSTKLLKVLWCFVGIQPVFGGGWYLLATMFGLLVVSKLADKHPKPLIVLAITSFGVELLFSNYGCWMRGFGSLYQVANNLRFQLTFFSGIIWIYTGYRLSLTTLGTLKLKQSRFSGYLILSVVGLIVEFLIGIAANFRSAGGATLITVLPICYYGVAIMLVNPLKIPLKISSFLSELSGYIFFTQFFFVWLGYRTPILSVIHTSTSFFWLVLVESSIASLLIIFVKKLVSSRTSDLTRNLKTTP